VPDEEQKETFIDNFSKCMPWLRTKKASIKNWQPSERWEFAHTVVEAIHKGTAVYIAASDTSARLQNIHAAENEAIASAILLPFGACFAYVGYRTRLLQAKVFQHNDLFVAAARSRRGMWGYCIERGISLTLTSMNLSHSIMSMLEAGGQIFGLATSVASIILSVHGTSKTISNLNNVYKRLRNLSIVMQYLEELKGNVARESAAEALEKCIGPILAQSKNGNAASFSPQFLMDFLSSAKLSEEEQEFRIEYIQKL